MANTVSIQYTCGCKFAHNTGPGMSQNNVVFTQCQSPHGLRTNAQKQDQIDQANKLINEMQQFRILTGN